MADSIVENWPQYFDDATITKIVERIQSDEFSGDELTQVLRKLFHLPQFGPHLTWLSVWVQNRDLDFLAHDRDVFPSVELFFKTLDFLSLNLAHPECGEVLYSLLQTFENIELDQLAQKWLIDYGLRYSDESVDAAALVGWMISEVLNSLSGNNKALVELALSLARTIQDDDFLLVLAMLEYVSDPEVESIAIKMLRSEDCFANGILVGPLLARNSKFENDFRDLLRDSEGPSLNMLLLSGADSVSKSYIKIALEYLENCSDLELVPGVLSRILESRCSSDVAAYAWKWFSKNRNIPNSCELLEAILLCEEFSVPEEAVAIAFEWCKLNPEHDYWARVLAAAIKKAATAEQFPYAVQNMSNCRHSPDEARIMLAINARPDTIEFDAIVMNWLKDPEKDRFALPWVLQVDQEVRVKRPEAFDELNDYMENLLLRTKKQVGSIYARLIDGGRFEVIPEALVWLFAPRLEWRWGGLHREKGELIKALLPHVPENTDLLEVAQSWLERGQHSYDDKVFWQCVLEAYQLAKQGK